MSYHFREQGVKRLVYGGGVWIAVAAAALVPACRSPRPSGDAAVLRGLVPERFGEQGTAMAAGAWWTAFGSEDLALLVSEALSVNPGLAQAAARLEQARAAARRQGAGVYPAATLSGRGASVRETSRGGGDGGADVTVEREEYGLELAASYELDLWGRVRAVRGSARKLAEASLEDLETAAMTVAGRVCALYVSLGELAVKIERVRRQIDANRSALDLLERRRRKGKAVALDVYQQQQALASTEALLPPLQAEAAVQRHELAVLLGRPPRAENLPEVRALPPLPPLPDTGLPAELVARRPDVRAAARRLEASDLDLDAAQADRLPALRLTASAAYASDDPGTLFDNWLLNLAAGLTMPLLDGGRRRAETDRTAAVREERVARYREAVLAAFREVEDALVRERRLREEAAALGEELDCGRKALTEARALYVKGQTDYLRVLTALASVQLLERRRISAEANLLRNRVALYRALGGGVLDAPLPPRAREGEEP
jgi:NodT family efflux transporter outer membrane factor (OMF) lipoprotein